MPMLAPPRKERLMKATVLALTALWAGAPRRSPGSPGEARDAARSDRRAADPGAGDPAGGARQDQGRPRAGHGVRHPARSRADAGPAPADQAGDPAEAHAGAVGIAAE